jgi:hypothetical protein
MKKKAIFCLSLVLTAVVAGAAEPSLKVSVLDNDVLCLRASRVPDNVPEQIRAASVPRHLAGTVLDLRFADGAATNAADYFALAKSPLVVLVNSQTRGAAAKLAAELRSSASAVLIGSTNLPPALAPDLVVAVSAEDERAFQDNPFFEAPGVSLEGSAHTNLLAFVDHTSEAELVRKRIKDGEDDGEVSTPRAEPPQPVVRDPALARALDLLKALAVLHPARG